MITITGNFLFQLEEQVLKREAEKENESRWISLVPYSLSGLQPNTSVEG